MTDPCIISAYSLSQREQTLKNRLYSNQKAKTTLFDPLARNTAGRAVQCEAPATAEARTVTDQNMNEFITDVRQEFAKSQMATGGTGMAQNFLYHKTQMLENHLGMLQKNQETMADLVKTVVKAGGAGASSKDEKIKYDICNENRRLLMESMAPLHRQIEEIKSMYEGNKETTKELYDNIETLKEIVKTKPYDVDAEVDRKYRTYRSNNRQINGAISTGCDTVDKMGVAAGISSEAYKQEAVKIKEQMQEVQRETQAMELEMQRQFARTLEENERCKLLLTAGISQPKISPPAGSGLSIRQRLGEFDYDSFMDSVGDVAVEVSTLEKKFRAGGTVYAATLVAASYPKGKSVPFYDFNVEPVQTKMGGKGRTGEKPARLLNVRTRTVVVPVPVKAEPSRPDLSKNIVDQVRPVSRPREASLGRSSRAAPEPTPARKPKTKVQTRTPGAAESHPRLDRSERHDRDREALSQPPAARTEEEGKTTSSLQRQMQELRNTPEEKKRFADRIEIKEYINDQVRQQVADVVAPMRATLVPATASGKESRPEDRKIAVPTDATTSAGKNRTDTIMSGMNQARTEGRRKVGESEIKGTVENVLVDMLWRDMQRDAARNVGATTAGRSGEQKSVQEEPEEYKEDFEQSDSHQGSSVALEKPGKAASPTAEKPPAAARDKAKQPPPEESKAGPTHPLETAGLAQSLNASNGRSQPPADPKSKPAVAPISTAQSLGTNTFTYIRREIQQIPQSIISIQPKKPRAEIVEEQKGRSATAAEHVRVDAEAEILKRRIQINVEPLMAGILEPPPIPAVAVGGSYSNPFYLNQAYAGLQIPPPHIVNVEEYDMSSTSYAQSDRHPDSSSVSEAEKPIGTEKSSPNKRPDKGASESEIESVSEGEVRPPPNTSSAEQSRRYDTNTSHRLSTPTSVLSQGEVRPAGTKVRGNIFSMEDFTYSEGEHVGSGANPDHSDNVSSKLMSDEEQSRVHELDEVEPVGRIREIQKQQDVLKQSQESFGLRSSVKAESMGRSGNGSEAKPDIKFFADDVELEDSAGNKPAFPFQMPK